ncbi:MAG: hypothetical protein AAGD06_32465 [Acidobacteriota bacterium]
MLTQRTHPDRPVTHLDLQPAGDLFHLIATTPSGRFRHRQPLNPAIAQQQRRTIQQKLDTGRSLDLRFWHSIQPEAPSLPEGHSRVRGRLLYTPNISYTQVPDGELRVARDDEPHYVLELHSPRGTYRSAMTWDERHLAEDALELYLPATDFTVAMDPEAWEQTDAHPGPLSLRVRRVRSDAYRLEFHTPCTRHRHPDIFDSRAEAEAVLADTWLSLPHVLGDWDYLPVQRTSRPFAFLALIDDQRVRHDHLSVWDTHHIPGFTQLQKGDRVELDLRPHAYQGWTQWTVVAARKLPGTIWERRIDERTRRVGRRYLCRSAEV